MTRTDLPRKGRGLTVAGWLVAGLTIAGPLLAARVPSNIRLAGLSGDELSSAELERGVQVLVVWASWSPRCRDIVGRAHALDSRWGRQARVRTVNFQEDRSTVEKFLSGQNFRLPVYLDRDGEASKALAVTALPGLVVVREGEILYQGRLPADADTLITDLLR